MGNFLLSSGSFVFTAIAIIGPSLGWEKLIEVCKRNPIRMLVPLIGFPAICGLIWIVRGFLFIDDASQNLDELQNNLYMLGILVYLFGTFLSVYSTLYVLQCGSTLKQRLKLMIKFAGPSVISLSMAAILFPRIIMPIYADPETSTIVRGAITTAGPPIVFFSFYTWQRLCSKSLKREFGDKITNPKYTCLPLVFIAIYWSRVRNNVLETILLLFV